MWILIIIGILMRMCMIAVFDTTICDRNIFTRETTTLKKIQINFTCFVCMPMCYVPITRSKTAIHTFLTRKIYEICESGSLFDTTWKRPANWHHVKKAYYLIPCESGSLLDTMWTRLANWHHVNQAHYLIPCDSGSLLKPCETGSLIDIMSNRLDNWHHVNQAHYLIPNKTDLRLYTMWNILANWNHVKQAYYLIPYETGSLFGTIWNRLTTSYHVIQAR